MSRQWGHGYWSGVRDATRLRSVAYGVMHVWHWHLRHCWWRAIMKPFSVENAWPYAVILTVLGFTLFVYPTREKQ